MEAIMEIGPACIPLRNVARLFLPLSEAAAYSYIAILLYSAVQFCIFLKLPLWIFYTCVVDILFYIKIALEQVSGSLKFS